MKAQSENHVDYKVSPTHDASGDDLVARALAYLETTLPKFGATMDSPGAVKDYLTLKLARLEREEFGVLLVNSQHAVIKYETMFVGTLAQTSVYPREVVKLALQHNAAGVILAHNHPSGSPEPSRADEFLTQTLKSALALVDVRVLDHMIVAGMRVTSFAERGLL